MTARTAPTVRTSLSDLMSLRLTTAVAAFLTTSPVCALRRFGLQYALEDLHAEARIAAGICRPDYACGVRTVGDFAAGSGRDAGASIQYGAAGKGRGVAFDPGQR